MTIIRNQATSQGSTQGRTTSSSTTSSASTTVTATAAATAEPPGLRRNLFHSAASRRVPTSNATGAGPSSVFGEEPDSTVAGGGMIRRAVGGRGSGDGSEDIVVRDQNGIACATVIPALPATIGQSQDGEEGLEGLEDERRNRESKLVAYCSEDTVADI